MFDALAVGLLVGGASLYLAGRSFLNRGSSPAAEVETDHACGCAGKNCKS